MAVVCFYTGPRKHFQLTKGREGECSSRVYPSCPSVCAWSLQSIPGCNLSPCGSAGGERSIAAPWTRLQPCPARGTGSRQGRALLPRKEQRKHSLLSAMAVAGDPWSSFPRQQGTRKSLSKGLGTCREHLWPFTPLRGILLMSLAHSPTQRCLQPVPRIQLPQMKRMMKYIQTIMPEDEGPPYAIMPSYMTAFQSSPVRI